MLEFITRKLVDWWLRSEAVRKMSALDDRLLADMGTSRTDITRFVAAQEQARKHTPSSARRHPDAVRLAFDN